MQIAICEDEPLIRQKVFSYIEKQFPTVTIQTFENGEELIKSDPCDIYLLDIHLDAMNGIEVAKYIREKFSDSEIIFITAYKDYVFEAFDVEALHYLVKPIDPVQLEKILYRAMKKIRSEKLSHSLTLNITRGSQTTVINEEDILFAEAHGRKIILHLQKEIVEYYGQISALESQLKGAFYRCHRSYIVHLKYIKRYNQQTITLINNETLHVARNQYKGFVERFAVYMNQEDKNE